MTLEEKKRLAAEQERSLQTRSTADTLVNNQCLNNSETINSFLNLKPTTLNINKVDLNFDSWTKSDSTPKSGIF